MYSSSFLFLYLTVSALCHMLHRPLRLSPAAPSVWNVHPRDACRARTLCPCGAFLGALSPRALRFLLWRSLPLGTLHILCVCCLFASSHQMLSPMREGVSVRCDHTVSSDTRIYLTWIACSDTSWEARREKM